MNQLVIYLALSLLGLCFGSFAGASVWRLRAAQLEQDKADGEDFDKVEYKKLQKIVSKNFINDRSKCLNCGYILKWYDMIPFFSWLLLGGKCRRCKSNIGWMEILIELSMAIFFVTSYILWPYSMVNILGVVRFILWLSAGVALAILFVYDKKWYLLPDIVNYAVILIGLINSVIIITSSSDKISAIISIVVSVIILSGLYLFLYTISKGRWIGFGDIKLGLGLALLIANWQLSFIALFAANLIGCLIIFPAMIGGKIKKNTHVPFGPLMILGGVVAMFFGNYLVNIYIYYLL